MFIDRGAADDWIRAHVAPTGAIESVHDRPWATVLRVPITRGVVWFKACAPVQAFEAPLTARLSQRWPDRVAEVIGHDDERGWLLLEDAGAPVDAQGSPPEVWLSVLPLYAELQRDEAARSEEHLGAGVPDMRLATLTAGYAELLQLDLPLEEGELRTFGRFAGRFAELRDELAAFNVPETIQHDDLHHMNLFARDGSLRVLDWGDSSVAHPFFSLVVTFRFLEERTGLARGDPWFA